MKVTFTRIRDRGYSVSVEGPNIPKSEKSPAPGYDDQLPHDAAHFIVENELGILGGVFGQLAAGGSANTFSARDAKTPRKFKARGARLAKKNKKDALFSEQAVYAAQSRWEKHDIIPATNIPSQDLDRIIEKFEEFGKQWSDLLIGGSVTLEWKPKRAKR